MNQYIIVINAGSSSIKYKVFNAKTNQDIVSGQCEKIGNPLGIFSLKAEGINQKEQIAIPNHQFGIKKILDELKSHKIILSFDEIVGVGHRVVIGGKKYKSSVIVDDEVTKDLIDYSPLAPLHNPVQVETIKVFEKLIPHVKNVATFDTSFHTSIPDYNNYALNQEVVKKYHIYRYGMHGTSYRYITARMEKVLNKKNVNLVICHLGNGASICEVENSLSHNTTMGLTPLEGLVMGTRCGDIDPSTAIYLIRQGLSADEVDNIFNKQSGLKGLAGSNDFRDISALANQGDANAKLAINMFVKRIAKYVVSYINELENKVDAIVFTAGIGENGGDVIQMIIDNIKIINLKIDSNTIFAKYDDVKLVSTKDSYIPMYQVRTNEELMIEQDVKSLLKI